MIARTEWLGSSTEPMFGTSFKLNWHTLEVTCRFYLKKKQTTKTLSHRNHRKKSYKALWSRLLYKLNVNVRLSREDEVERSLNALQVCWWLKCCGINTLLSSSDWIPSSDISHTFGPVWETTLQTGWVRWTQSGWSTRKRTYLHAHFLIFCECSYPTQAEDAIISPKSMQLWGWYVRNPDI